MLLCQFPYQLSDNDSQLTGIQIVNYYWLNGVLHRHSTPVLCSHRGDHVSYEVVHFDVTPWPFS